MNYEMKEQVQANGENIKEGRLDSTIENRRRTTDKSLRRHNLDWINSPKCQKGKSVPKGIKNKSKKLVDVLRKINTEE